MKHRFQQNMATYQNLITKSMYDKQLDSGKGTLLHLCDDVIQQEVGFRPIELVASYHVNCSKIYSILQSEYAGQRGDNFLFYFDGAREVGDKCMNSWSFFTFYVVLRGK